AMSNGRQRFAKRWSVACIHARSLVAGTSVIDGWPPWIEYAMSVGESTLLTPFPSWTLMLASVTVLIHEKLFRLYAHQRRAHGLVAALALQCDRELENVSAKQDRPSHFCRPTSARSNDCSGVCRRLFDDRP